MTTYSRTAAGALTLPSKFYTSPEIFDLERERIVLKHWLYAGRADRASAPGDYFLLNIEGESIIVVRGEHGRLHAHYNVCRHRGTRLCTEPGGKLSKSIQCPYHAWTYGLDGELLAAPNMADVHGFERSQFPLHSIAVAEWEGSIFLNFDPEASPFEQSFAPLLSKFSKWRLAELRVAHSLTYDVAANWKLIFQNYSECYHCPSLHPALNRLTPYRNSSNDLEEGPFLGGPMRLARAGGSMTMSGRRCAPPVDGLSDEDLDLVYYYTIFPNLLLSLCPDYLLMHRIERQAPDRTRIVCDWLFHPDAMAGPDFDASDAIEFWNMTNKQDWHVSELSQRGISSRAYQPGPYSDLESMVAAWDRHYRSVLGEV